MNAKRTGIYRHAAKTDRPLAPVAMLLGADLCVAGILGRFSFVASMAKAYGVSSPLSADQTLACGLALLILGTAVQLWPEKSRMIRH